MIGFALVALSLTATGCGGCGVFGGPQMNAGEECCFEELAAGSGHNCAIDDGGELVCWGFDEAGGTNAPSGTFADVAAHRMEACALDGGGEIQCWGDTSGSAPDGPFSALDVGCAVDADGDIQCWDGTDEAELPQGQFQAVSGSCAIDTDDQLRCWGDGDAYPDGESVTAVVGGSSTGCAIGEGGAIQCWGDDTHGRTNPPEGNFTALTWGVFHACAVGEGGDIDCWGMENVDDEFIDVEFDQHLPDQYLDQDATFTDVAAGQNHTCALDTDGYIHCWGDNSEGAVSPP